MTWSYRTVKPRMSTTMTTMVPVQRARPVGADPEEGEGQRNGGERRPGGDGDDPPGICRHGLEAEPLQPAIHGTAAQAQRPCGLGHIAVHARQGLLHQQPLHFLECHLLQVRRVIRRAEREIGNADLALIGEEDGALEGVIGSRTLPGQA